MLRIIQAWPPLLSEIVAAFPKVQSYEVIFAWGETIFNPKGIAIGDDLMAHEHVHMQRQLAGPGSTEDEKVIAWWRRYMADPEFRLAEEIPAHIAEFKIKVGQAHGRPERRRMARAIATRLASPLYGNLITVEKAIKIVQEKA